MKAMHLDALLAGFHCGKRGINNSVVHAVGPVSRYGSRGAACGAHGRFIVDAFAWQNSWATAPAALKCNDCFKQAEQFAKDGAPVPVPKQI